MKALHMITFLLVILGALNWGFVGIFDFNLVTYLVWEGIMGTQIIYWVIWLSAILEIVTHPKSCQMCKK
jgi:uncharacterized membrane protein YuzA (DUF378 family)